MAELQKALKVVQTTIKHRGAKLLFNQKVDPVALGLNDYFKIVEHPMDLGTVCDRLSAVEYSSPSQVTLLIAWSPCNALLLLAQLCGRPRAEAHALRWQVKSDVDLIWNNCYLYNR